MASLAYLSQCGGLPFYAPAAFSEPAEAELGSLPSEVALREALERGEIPYVRSTHGWRRIAEDEDEAEFASGHLVGQLEVAKFKREDGRWRYRGGSSDCDPTSIVGAGPVVTWSLATPKSKQDVVVRRIQVNLGPGDCSGFMSHTSRARLAFRPWGRKLLMTVWLKPLPPGVYLCPAVYEPPLKVTLPRKVKLSKLYDGSTYPPRPAL